MVAGSSSCAVVVEPILQLKLRLQSTRAVMRL